MTILKVATLGFVLATFAIAYLIFVGWLAWSLADFDCSGTYWQCHRGVSRELVIYLALPLLGWTIYAVLLVRAWKRA